MAFTGVATVVQISTGKFHITGLSLAGDASGTIGLVGKTVPAEVSLDAPEWGNYKNAQNDAVSLIDAVEVRTNPTTDVTAGVPISIVKTGADVANFVATLHNDSAATVSGVLEIYVEFH